MTSTDSPPFSPPGTPEYAQAGAFADTRPTAARSRA